MSILEIFMTAWPLLPEHHLSPAPLPRFAAEREKKTRVFGFQANQATKFLQCETLSPER